MALPNEIHLRTPSSLTDQITDFAKSIVGTNPQLEFNKIDPSPGCVPNKCHENVYAKIAAWGGEAVFGWSIWECPLWIEAEFHSIWRRAEGHLSDITPDADGESHRLFLTDVERFWDPAVRKSHPRRYFLKTDDHLISRFIHLVKEQDLLRTSYASGENLSSRDADKYEKLQQEAQRQLERYFRSKSKPFPGAILPTRSG